MVCWTRLVGTGYYLWSPLCFLSSALSLLVSAHCACRLSVFRYEILGLPWSFREIGTGARYSVFCCGIGVEWFQTEGCVPPGGRIVTVASKCRHCRFSCAEFHHSSHSSSETSPLRVCLSSHSLTVDGKCCGSVELSDRNVLAVHDSGYVLQDTAVN